MQHGEAPQPRHQVLGAGHHADRGVVVAGDALRRRVHDQVDAVGDRVLPEGRGERGVDDRGGPVDRPQRVEVDEVEARIGRRLGEHQHGAARLDGSLEGTGLGAVHEGHVDAQAGAHRLEEQLGAEKVVMWNANVHPEAVQHDAKQVSLLGQLG